MDKCITYSKLHTYPHHNKKHTFLIWFLSSNILTFTTPNLEPNDDWEPEKHESNHKEWKVEKYDDVKYSDRYNTKYYRDPEALSENGNRLWWSKDTAGHGGTRWKLYEETDKGLRFYKDVDKYGQYISGKHKGPTGRTVEWKELRGVNDPKIIKGK